MEIEPIKLFEFWFYFSPEVWDEVDIYSIFPSFASFLKYKIRGSDGFLMLPYGSLHFELEEVLERCRLKDD